MYLIGVLVFIVFLIVSILLSSSLMAFINLPSLFIILALSLPVLMASGLLPDFFKGFKLMGHKVNNYSIIELKRINQANILAIKSLLLSGAVGTTTGIISMLKNLNDPSAIGSYLAVAILTVLYSLVFVFLILPIQARVKATQDTME